MAHHIIHKQKVVLRTNMSADAFKLQNRISNLFKNDLPARLESLFDQASPKGKILRIDKLQLDIGTINEKNLESEFIEKLIEKLIERFSRRFSEGRVHVAKKMPAETIFDEIKPQQSLAHALIYFLKHGLWPWYQPTKNVQEFESDILLSFSEKEWAHLIELLKKDIPANESAVKRLVMQFSENFLEKILFQLDDTPGKNLQTFHERVHFMLEEARRQTGFSIREFQIIFWKHATVTALDKTHENDFFAELLKKLNDEIEGISNDAGKIKPVMNDDKTEEIKNKSKRKDEVREDEIFTDNCGIVILHPFLQIYFLELGLFEEKAFKDTESQHRAVLLLHYLATGETEVAEFNLVLPKILCDVDISEAVPNYIELTEKEKEESANLLKAVTEHWEPLRRTSSDGLRASFFQREGKLVPAETGWILKVEQKAIDILLEKLPWGIRTIKLPWMKNVLNVEWC